MWETRVWIPSKLKFFSRLLFWSFLSCRPPARVLSSLECHFYDNLWFIYLKKKIPYASLCRGKWGAREQSAMASGIAEPGCFVPESSALIVKLPPVSHTISFNLSISLSFLRTRNATPSFHVPSVISQSLEALRSNMENKNQPSCSILCFVLNTFLPLPICWSSWSADFQVVLFFNYWLSEFCTL